jgi:taurine dioxygenase
VIFTRTGPVIGAEVSDIDLSDTSASEIRTIADGLAEHEVLVFRGQPISSESQLDFGRQFGELVVSPFSPAAANAPELIVLDYSADSPARLTDIWHADETYRPCPPKITILKSVITPELGGDTMFCSMRAAYDGLSDRMQAHIAGLTAHHGFGRFSKLLAADPDGMARLHEVEGRFPHPQHPVVALHPDTGRKVLYVNRHFTEHINELPEDEGRAILALLLDRTARPEHQLRVTWQPGTVVMWDNRSVQHYAPHDYWPQRRRMERVTVAGSAPIPDGDSGQVSSRRVEVQNVSMDDAVFEAAARPHER